MENKVCYVIGAGDFFGFRKKPAAEDLIIAADGGYRHCLREEIVPDLLLGDFDSLGEVPVFDNVMRVPVEKDDTDTMLALRVGLERGCDTFHIYGGTGGRLDHTLANLQSLAFLAAHSARGYLYDDGFVYTAVKDGGLAFRGTKDDIFSVFALGGTAHGVTISGGQYPLKDADLAPDFPLGVSNHFAKNEVHISVSEGTLIVGWQIRRDN